MAQAEGKDSSLLCEDSSNHALEDLDHKTLAGFTLMGVGHKVL